MFDVHDLPVPAVLCRTDGLVREANAHARALFGRDVCGEQLPDRPRISDERDGVPFVAELRATRLHDGSRLVLLAELTGTPLLDETSQLFDVAFEHVPLGMALYNTRGEFIRVNRAMCAILDREPGQVIGLRDQLFTHPDDRQSDLDAAKRILDGEIDSHHCEKRFVRPDDSAAWVLANLVFLRDENGNPLCWMGTFQDITSRKRAEDRLRRLAEQDAVTGLVSRDRFIEELETRIAHAGRSDEHGAVLVLEVAGFDEEVDREAVAAMAGRLRATDLLGRLADDRFAVLLAHVGAEGARVVAGELTYALRAAGLRATGGVALYGPDAPASAEGLIASASRAVAAAGSAP